MEIVYRLEGATARQVKDELTDAISYTTVRTHMRILVEKAYLRRCLRGNRYIYFPVTPKNEAMRLELEKLISIYFGGSSSTLIRKVIDSYPASNVDEVLQRHMAERNRDMSECI